MELKVPEGFTYSNDLNSEWMKKSELKSWINDNKKYFDMI